jgi:DNA polymerase III subunit epsilon
VLAKLFQLKRKLIVFDLETTSADPALARIVSIGMSIHEADGRHKKFSSLINPEMPIPKSSTAVHGISDETIATCCAFCRKTEQEHSDICTKFMLAPKFSDLAKNFHAGFSDADFSGYNIKFDLKVMVNEFDRCKLQFDAITAKIIDPFRIWQVAVPRTLTDAYAVWCGKKLEGAHDAMIDTMAAEEVLIAQVELLRSLGIKWTDSLDELHDKCWPRDPNAIDSEGKFIFINGIPCLNFGKYRGQPMEKCKGYLGWMMDNDFPAEVKRIIKAGLAGNWPTQQSSIPL